MQPTQWYREDADHGRVYLGSSFIPVTPAWFSAASPHPPPALLSLLLELLSSLSDSPFSLPLLLLLIHSSLLVFFSPLPEVGFGVNSSLPSFPAGSAAPCSSC